jgi:hypothetical protein
VKAFLGIAALAAGLACPQIVDAQDDEASMTFDPRAALAWMPRQGPFMHGIVVTVYANGQPVKTGIDTGKPM